VLLVGIAAVSFLALLPVRFGGSVTYVRTSGISMLPRFHAGDLVLVRTASRYDVGDIVAYRSPLLRRVVLHRIVGRDGDAFVFKGDNNERADEETLGREHIVGRFSLRVPKAGNAVAWTSDPMKMTLFAGAALSGSAGTLSRRRRDASRQRDRKRSNALVTSPDLGVARNVMIVIGAAALAVAGVAALRPATTRVATSVGYTHRGAWSYDAAVAAGPVYRDGHVNTGDVVFRRLTDAVRVEYDYTLSTAAPHSIEGSVRMYAELRDSSGWSQTVRLTAARSFEGDTVRSSATLDLADFDRRFARFHAATGIEGSDHHVSVVARTDVEGRVDGRVAESRFVPRLEFVLQPLALRPVAMDNGTAVGAATNPFAPTKAENVMHPRPAPRRWKVAGRAVNVSTARSLGLVVGVPMLLFGLALAAASRRATGGDEAARIRARYGRSLVPVAGVAGDETRAVVDVASIEALMQLAHHHGTLVMHHDDDSRHTYLVDVSGVVYRYRIQ
jgi:signal peptidase I